MIELASEATTTAFGMSQWLELAVILSTLILTIATVGLWVATAQVHKDEIIKMSGDLSHANDNMTEVALAEIDAHREKVQTIRKISHRKARR